MHRLHPSTTSPKIPHDAQQGWVLLTLLVLLTAVSLVAMAATVVWMRQQHASERHSEKLELAALALALRSHVMDETTIPHPTNIPRVVALRLGQAPIRVHTNRQGNPRVILHDPELRLGPTGTDTLPYVQGTNGSRPPIHARLIIASSLGLPLPQHLTSGGTLTAHQFSNLWHTAEGGLPADWNGSGLPGDLCLERVDLTDLFVPVTLRYYSDAAPHRGRYLVSDGPSASLPGVLPSDSFTNTFVRGTLLSLFGTSGSLQFREILQDGGRVYTCQDGVWRLGEGTSGSRLGPVVRHPTPEEFSDALIAFLNTEVSVWPNNTGSSKADLVAAITNFLAAGAYNNQGSAMANAQGALIDAWVDFTGAQPNKP